MRHRLLPIIRVVLATVVCSSMIPPGAVSQPEAKRPGTLPAEEIGATLGVGGHFIQHRPKIYLNNPEGKAFDVELFFFVKGWRNPTRKEQILLTDPEGNTVISGKKALDENRIKLEVEEAIPGVYVLEPGRKKDGSFAGRVTDYWLQTTLDEAVLETGPPDGHAVNSRWLMVQPTVPIRWWFWVPKGVREFDVVTQKTHSYSSQREDGAVTVYSPRGQPMDALIGQIHRSKHTEENVPWTRSATIEVEPGTSGRFWSMEVELAGAHHRCNIAVTIDGVPELLANSPEAWFNPETGEKPDVSVYDHDPFMQAAPEKKSDFWEKWPGGLSMRGGIRHWSPAPAVGDPDGSRIWGDGTLAFWNPDQKSVRFELGDYLPHVGGKRASEEERARVTVRDTDGRTLYREKHVVPHHAGNPEKLPALGKGVRYMDISSIAPGLDRWYAFTYPAIPTVLVGENTEGKWHRFNLEVANMRQWYFYVPEGTKQFDLRYETQEPDDRLKLYVNSPISTAELSYGKSDRVTVDVPAGTDGRIWHIRPSVGGGTRMPRADIEGDRDNLGIDVRLKIRGVPPYLSPTWEQWFNPTAPEHPLNRGKEE